MITNNIDSWAASVRSVKGNQKHRLWQPVLSPPPLLHDVAVVLVAPKRPVSIGTVARSLSCFECPDLRIVQPRCELLTRASRNSSKGAQYLLHNAQVYKSLEDALKGCGMAAAFARWLPAVEDEEDVMVDGVQGISALHKRQPLLQLQGVPALLQHVAAAQQQLKQQQQQQPHQLECVEDVQASPSLALVFGREEAGLTNEEIHACDCAVSISIGRLQESLSLSHAVSIALSQLYQQRLDQGAHACSTITTMDVAHAYTPASRAQLAAGWREQGKER